MYVLNDLALVNFRPPPRLFCSVRGTELHLVVVVRVRGGLLWVGDGAGGAWGAGGQFICLDDLAFCVAQKYEM